MKNAIILLTIAFALNNPSMAQTRYYKPLFQEKDIRILLSHKDSTDIYLTSVSLYEAVPDGRRVPDSVKLEEAFYVDYVLSARRTDANSVVQSDDAVSAVFLKSDDGAYTIMESTFNLDYTVTETSPPKDGEIKIADRIDLDPREPTPYTFVGCSDNETLFAVKAWNYIRERTGDEK